MVVLKWLDENFEEFLLMIFLFLMVSIMGVQVFMRYILNSSLRWSEEATRYLFIWSAFLSTSYCVKKSISIKIDQFTDLLPKESIARKVVAVVVKLIMLAFFIYIFIYSIDVVRAAYQSGQRSPAMGVPMYLIQSSTVVGFGLSVVRCIQNLFKNQEPPSDIESEVEEIVEMVDPVEPIK